MIVKAWVSANYSGTWIEEKPDWFTERVNASISKDMVPESEVEQTSVPGKRKIFAVAIEGAHIRTPEGLCAIEIIVKLCDFGSVTATSSPN